MKKFFHNIAQSLSLFSINSQDNETNSSSLNSNSDANIENDSPSINNDDINEKIQQIIEENLSNKQESTNSVVDKNYFHKVIEECLKKQKIHDDDDDNDNDDSSKNTSEAILALLQEIQVQLQSIINASNFVTYYYEEQCTEVVFTNLTSEIFESFLSRQQVSLIEESKKIPLGVVCQIRGKHKRISAPDKDVDQHETSAKGERHIRDEEYFEEFLKEIQEGLNRGFYRKRRRCWSRFSFIPSTTVSSQDISANQSSDNSSQLSLISKSMSHEILQQTPPNSSSVGENKIFSKTNNKIARKFPLPSQEKDENNPFQSGSTFLSPTSSLNKKISLESNGISKISNDSQSRSVESTSNASSLSLSAFQLLDETKQNDSEQKLINLNLQSDMELSREINVLEQQNENSNNNNNTTNNMNKSDDVDVESAAGSNLIIADESVLKLARALNIAKRFQNENKVLWQQITRLKNLLNEKDLEIKRVKLHSRKEASQDEVKILKDKLTILEQEQTNMSQNLRKSEKLCREYERDLDGLEKNLEFAEQRRKSLKTNCICKSESSKQNFNFGVVPEKDNEDQESECENQEDIAEGTSCLLQQKGNKIENPNNEKGENSSLLLKRHTSYEKSRSGHTLRNTRLRKEFKNNKSFER